MINRDLTKYFDRGIWISDDRISAFISSRTNGINQIDYHGKQPVSRNAQIFKSNEGILNFSFNYKLHGKNEKIPVLFYIIDWNPNEVIYTHSFYDLKFTFLISVVGKSLICKFEIINQFLFDVDLSFDIIWNKDSLSTDVHGNRTWSEIIEKENYIELGANDKIYINEWIKREGDYQGDFLIPESWRRMVFKNKKMSGQAKYDDLKDEYKDQNLILYDADIYAVMGGSGYQISNLYNGYILFRNLQNIKSGKLLTFDPFILSFGDSKGEVHSNIIEIGRNYRNSTSEKTNYYNKMFFVFPQLSLSNHETLKDLFFTIPGIVESAEVKDIQMTRACSSSYYWIWAWDNMVSALELSRWNNLKLLKGIINFIRIHRDIDGTIPMQWSRALEPMDSRGFGCHDFLLARLIQQYYYCTNDIYIIRENYPGLIYAFERLFNSCNDFGFSPSIGIYPDFPGKLGRTEDSFTGMEIGCFYSFALMIEQFAYLMNDPLNLQKAHEIVKKLKDNFLNCFYDTEKRFLVDSIDKDLQKIKTYPLFTFLFSIFSPGISLIREKIYEISEFIFANHFENHGIALVPKWDINRLTESAMPSWYPFWDIIPIKLFRRTNNVDAINKWIELVSKCYEYFGYCPEFVSLESEKMENNKWLHRGSPWNLNCSTGWYHCLIEGIFGIDEDIGGITYIPAKLIKEELRVINLFLRGIQTEVEILGDGPYVKLFEVNGAAIEGCLKIPQKYFDTKKVIIRIEHCFNQPDLLVKEVNGASVTSIFKDKDEVIIEFEGFGTIEIFFSAVKKPNLRIDQKELLFNWNEDRNEGCYYSFLHGKHNLHLNI